MSKPIPEAAPPAETPGPNAPTTAALSTTTEPPLPYYGTPVWLHAGSVVASVLGPLGLMLPPRQMNLRNLFLVGGTFFATSQVTYDYTGQSIYQRFQSRASDFSSNDLPAAAQQRSDAMRAERERRAAAAAAAAGLPAPAPAQAGKDNERGVLEKVWLGKENENWIEERKRKEKEMLDSGEGYWGLIISQVSEVWTDLRKGGSSSSSSSSSKPEETNETKNDKK